MRLLHSVAWLPPPSDNGAVPRDAECAKRLQKRTLTNLYNARPDWLALAHKRLDEAVFGAYGWPAALTDEEILERLLALNIQRATETDHGNGHDG